MKPQNPKQVNVETSRKVTPPPMMSAPFTGIKVQITCPFFNKNQLHGFTSWLNPDEVFN